MDISISFDPMKMGPGIWFFMHITALRAVTNTLKESFIININQLCDNFKCEKCKTHFRKFIDEHPLRNYWNIYENKKDVGFFKWTWELHNQVNKFLNKPCPSFFECYNYYSNNDVGLCFDCSNAEQITLAVQQDIITIPPILTLYREKGNIKPQPFRT